MVGETDLAALLRSMSAELDDELYVFATLTTPSLPVGVVPLMLFREAEGTSLILSKADADAAGIACEFPCRRITLNVHSALEAVGFIARIASALAAQGMGVNPVAGFYHDHLFVPDGREDEAMTVLRELAVAGSA